MQVSKGAHSKTSQGRTKARTSDILGNAKPSARIDPKWEQQYETLLEMREQFRRQKGQLVRDALEEYTGLRRDPADVGTNTYDRDWALGMVSSDQNALYEIDDALDRIRSGTYGVCQLTGQIIPPERLQAIPWTRFSAEAEHELEVTGQLRRPRLGNRESLAYQEERRGEGETEEPEES